MTVTVVFKEGRQRPADYIAICNNIADSYPNGRPHGVQKDAIQNAIDAAKGRAPVHVHFEVVENSKGRFFTITDSNTIGLTGPVLHDFDDYDRELPEDFHCARFEAFAFTKANPDALGARGQGKFMFLSVSKSYAMFYDTLREDGIYRLGATQAQSVGCPILPGKDVEPWEGERAERDPEIAPRVNWGLRFADLGVTAFNRTDKSFDVAIVLTVLHGDRAVLEMLQHKRLVLGAKRQETLGPFEMVIDQDVFDEVGEYRLTASLFDAATGDKIDGVSRHFWVEQDPPFRKPFDLVMVDGFPEPNQKRQWLISGSINNSATLLYNAAHPAYRLAEEDEEKLGDYLLDLVLEGAVQFVLNRPDRDDGGPDYHPLNAERILGAPKALDREAVPAASYEEVHRYLSDVRWRMLEVA